ncbi:MAG TPA: DnaJ domain-containing protein [Candidatus Limnocylindrales bacterium]|nr:DnaJ domain-containing protein [Candidatus Limnocylindrales bacterium]
MPPERDAYDVLQVSRSASWPEMRAAYRSLARRYHPDGASPDTPRMVEINAAYEQLEREHGEGDRGTSRGVPVGPGRPADATAFTPPPAPPVQRFGPLMRRVMANRGIETPVIDFGQYAGWQIADVAAHDPGYLRWLSRHSSGIRFRAVIERVLGTDPDVGRRAALVR